MTAQELKQLQSNAQRLAASGTASQRTTAAAMLARLKGMPDETLIEIVFRDARLTATDRRLIEVLAKAPGSTSAELTAAMGWRAQSWHLKFGLMCRDRLAPYRDPPSSEVRTDDDGNPATYYSGLLADYDAATSGFRLKDDARAALVAAGALDET